MRHLSNIDANKQPKLISECLRGDWALVVSMAFFSKSACMTLPQKIQKLEIESDKTFMQNKLKICKTDFLQIRKIFKR